MYTRLSLITNQIIKIHEGGGFWTEVKRRCMCVKVWIHFIAGDTSGHNNLVWQMNGGWPKFIYWDCRYLFGDLSSPIPKCSLITSEEPKQARLTEDGLTNLCKKHFQCFWKRPFWWPEVWITRTCSCRNFRYIYYYYPLWFHKSLIHPTS